LGVAIAQALKKAQPGTTEFRVAVRDALETVREVKGADGIFNMSAVDHLGMDQRAVIMAKVENGAWKIKALSLLLLHSM
jgi:branched-chain amino acid transport system substrate-binding protein